MAKYQKSRFEAFGKSFIVVEVSDLSTEDEDFLPVMTAGGFMATKLDFPAIPAEQRHVYEDVEVVVGQDFVGEIIIKSSEIAAKMTAEEVEAIMTHEASHLMNGDIYKPCEKVQVGAAWLMSNAEAEYTADQAAAERCGGAVMASAAKKAVGYASCALALLVPGDKKVIAKQYFDEIMTDPVLTERMRRLQAM